MRAFDFALHPWVRKNPLCRYIPALLKNRLKLILKWRYRNHHKPAPEPAPEGELSPAG
ncbi:MAG: hypothetical protein IT394_14050 [Candidatus Omnitrophica bacterium]|nr:hypothetical protein [Candidatus Omnitrophota bacterium]